MNQCLNYCADEDDYVAPKYRLLGIIMDIDGCITINWQTWYARCGFTALLKSSDFSHNYIFVTCTFLRFDMSTRRCLRGWRSRRYMIVKLKRMNVITCGNARVIESKEKIMTHSRIGAIIAHNISAAICALIKYKVHCNLHLFQNIRDCSFTLYGDTVYQHALQLWALYVYQFST